MPYIKKENREKYEKILNEFRLALPTEEGDVNYIISSMLKLIWEASSKNYSTANALVGVLECAKLELYRRTIAELENSKIMENGDI